MDENKLFILYRKQAEIYRIYDDEIRDSISFIESEFHKFPIPFLNEIRAAQDHMARCFSYSDNSPDWEEYVEGQMDKARGHYTRCLLDCHKYIWHKYGRRLYWSHLLPKYFGNLRDIDNGEFYKEYKRLQKESKELNKQARAVERTDKERAKELLQDAIGNLKQIDDMFEENCWKIRWSVAKQFSWRILMALGWIISGIYFFVRNSDPIAKILAYISSFFGSLTQ